MDNCTLCVNYYSTSRHGEDNCQSKNTMIEALEDKHLKPVL